jgi:hypothetical protein
MNRAERLELFEVGRSVGFFEIARLEVSQRGIFFE